MLKNLAWINSIILLLFIAMVLKNLAFNTSEKQLYLFYHLIQQYT